MHASGGGRLNIMEEIENRQALKYAENLTLPAVIVVSANMGCDHCQQRVSQLISKMNGVEDCVVDVGKGQVTMRGLISNNKKKMMKKKKKDRGIIISGSNKETIIEGLTAVKSFSYAVLFHLFMKPITTC
ncbi:uncharacterized protein LOC113302419 isoform X2 [Papaver somniferum]|uniref:uncharacterized protein LOC113302419 isoform X2 n=1 Tax=Papaver somniferum TaxID=3469 RepID=UPI000E6F9511|nr:uncharacterized protein LOC113302419 isoform X2 [Papaver somniferum]